MSSIVRFFVASPADAAGSLAHGPGASLRSVDLGNFDAEEALLDWEAHLTGSTFDDLLDRNIPEILAEEEDGAIVFLLSADLLGKLASLSDTQIDEMANWWSGKKAQDGFPIDVSVARQILQGLIRLIREERSPEQHVYCWTA